MPRLSASRVIEAAVELADEIGIDALTIRRLATALDVKPMTLYHHVANKEAIVDGMVDAVFGEFEPPSSAQDGWRDAMQRRANSMREALARHPWATPLLDSRRTPGPNTLQLHEATLACLDHAGFSLAMAGHTVALLDAYVYGFALQEAALPATHGADIAQLASEIAVPLDPATFPHLLRFTERHVLAEGYDFRAEFGFGLGLVLDGIATRL